MKKEVTICDALSGRCRILADRVCPLCEKDFCSGHLKSMLFAQLCVRKLSTPQSGQSPSPPGFEKYDMHNVEESTINICDGCYDDLERAQRGSSPKFESTRLLKLLAEEGKAKLIEAARAGLAVYKLANSEGAGS